MTAIDPAAALEPAPAAPLVLALPKGRILEECRPLLAGAGIRPVPDYADEASRRLRFPTDDPGLDVGRRTCRLCRRQPGSSRLTPARSRLA